MFRQPDVSATHITFVYAGDIWVVPKTGGLAQRLSSPPGEESFPRFSPDGKKPAFIDQTQAIRVYDIDAKTLKTIDSCNWLIHPALEGFEVRWSADSNWIAYARPLSNQHAAVFLHDLASAKSRQVTSGFYTDYAPVFDPDGKYLYFLSDRSLDPVYSSLDETWVYPNTTRIIAVPLRRDVPSPLAARNDVETPAKEEPKPDKEKKPGKDIKGEPEKDKKEEKEKKPEPLRIDLEGFSRMP